MDKATQPENTSSVTISHERFTDLQNAAHLFGVLKEMLIAHGCPWPDPCHVPTTVGGWLDEVCKGWKDGA